jgi:hypothetical protein
MTERFRLPADARDVGELGVVDHAHRMRRSSARRESAERRIEAVEQVGCRVRVSQLGEKKAFQHLVEP